MHIAARLSTIARVGCVWLGVATVLTLPGACQKDCGVLPPCGPGVFDTNTFRCLPFDGSPGVDATRSDASDAGAARSDAGDDASDDGDDGDDGGSDAEDARPGADALACGGQTCGEGQICVYEFCGGGPVSCLPVGDGGACSDGWTYQDFGCPGTGISGAAGPGCFPPPCTSPPPRCADRPSGCGPTLTCFCIPPSTCDGISCAMTSGRTVTCARS